MKLQLMIQKLQITFKSLKLKSSNVSSSPSKLFCFPDSLSCQELFEREDVDEYLEREVEREDCSISLDCDTDLFLVSGIVCLEQKRISKYIYTKGPVYAIFGFCFGKLTILLTIQQVHICTGVPQNLKTCKVIEIQVKEKLEFDLKPLILN